MKPDLKVGMSLLILGIIFVIVTPVVAINIIYINPVAVSFIRIFGIMLAAMSTGTVLVYRKDSGKFRMPP